MPSPPILSNVVFDVGNVLIEWDPRHLFRSFFGTRADAMEWFLAHVCTPAWNLQQDAGRSWEEATTQLCSIYPEWRYEVEAYDSRWHLTAPSAIKGSVAILDRLKRAGVPLFAVTNFSTDKFLESRARFAFLEDFRGIVVSGNERKLKPHAPIYQLLLERYDLDPISCVFIDDSLHNVEGARAVGMTGIHFTGPGALERDLRMLGFEF